MGREHPRGFAGSWLSSSYLVQVPILVLVQDLDLVILVLDV
jgi:hypothetical protein